MENLTILLEKLAEKLGTTTEYLWGVLLKQAHVYSITHVMYFIMLLFAGFVLYIIHMRLSIKNECGHNVYYEREEGVIVPMVIAITFWATMLIFQLILLGDLVNAFCNPEYWALKEVLGIIN